MSRLKKTLFAMLGIGSVSLSRWHQKPFPPVVSRFEATAQARGLIGRADAPGLEQPEQLVALLAEQLAEGLDAQARKG